MPEASAILTVGRNHGAHLLDHVPLASSPESTGHSNRLGRAGSRSLDAGIHHGRGDGVAHQRVPQQR